MNFLIENSIELISSWLVSSNRSPSGYSNFDLIDIEESFEPGVECVACKAGAGALSLNASKIKEFLANALIHSRNDEQFLKDVASSLSWEVVKASIVLPSIPSITTTIHGEFGEILTDLILVQFYGYEIPVPKRWYMITANQTLPGTDTLAIKLDNGRITEVCYVESKLRATNDTMAAKEAYEELAIKHQQGMPVIVSFILKRMHEQKSPLLGRFMEYLRDMNIADERDTFRMGLTWEKNKWTEKVLENLELHVTATSGIGGRPKCTVHCIRIKELATLIEEVFQGVKVI